MTEARYGHAERVALVTLLAFAAALIACSPAGAAPPPAISAPEAIVVESSTGDVAYSLDPDRARPIASTTKLMTALLSIRRARLDETFTAAPYQASAAESRINLRDGERLSVRDLLRGLLLASANDAAVTLAEGVAGSESAFVRLMNREARRLGLRGTSYSDPIGLDGDYSSARDLARLAILLRRSDFARRTMNLERATLRTGDGVRRVVNRNVLVREVPWVNGVKTGYTAAAGYVLIGSAQRRGVDVVSVVLGEPSEAARFRDTLALLRWGLGRYKRVTPVRRGRTIARTDVRYGGGATVALAPARSASRVVRRGRRVSTLVRVPHELRGPLPAGRRVGTVVVRVGGREVDRVPVVTAQRVPAPSRVEQLSEAVLRPLVLLPAALALIAVSLSVGLARRRRKTIA
jgi:D-alanyl-D-alanine carboxypeptidase (penicillin-binding protein 5/6)